MVTTSQVMLGKLPSRVDPRTLSLARYLDRELLPAPPPELDLAEQVISWPMYANDRIGDCTTAAAAHMVEAWTAAATVTPLWCQSRRCSPPSTRSRSSTR